MEFEPPNMDTNSVQRARSTKKMTRLLRMRLPELVCRTKQEAFRWTERMRPSWPGRSRAFVHSAKDVEQFSHGGEDHFFRGVFDNRLPGALAIGAPDHCREIIASANKICQGRFD